MTLLTKPWLDEQEFYEVCQRYRHAKDLRGVLPSAADAFEELKNHIRAALSAEARRQDAVSRADSDHDLPATASNSNPGRGHNMTLGMESAWPCALHELVGCVACNTVAKGGDANVAGISGQDVVTGAAHPNHATESAGPQAVEGNPGSGDYGQTGSGPAVPADTQSEPDKTIGDWHGPYVQPSSSGKLADQSADGQDTDRVTTGIAASEPALSAAHERIRRLEAALETIADGWTDRFPGAPDLTAATTPVEFRASMWSWSQNVARAALSEAEPGQQVDAAPPRRGEG